MTKHDLLKMKHYCIYYKETKNILSSFKTHDFSIFTFYCKGMPKGAIFALCLDFLPHFLRVGGVERY